MAKISGMAESLDDRLKYAASVKNLDVHTLAGRVLSEGVLRHWRFGMGEAPIELKGGMLFDQCIRETSDADVTTIRRYMPHEMERGMDVVRDLLRAEGIDLEYVSPGPRLIDVGYGDPVERWVLRGKVGDVRACSRLDIALGRGPDVFSSIAEVSEIPSVVSGLPSLAIACQPLEAAAAEKLLAVVLQPINDTRVKHLADIADARLWEGVDYGGVASEVLRVCRHRGINICSLSGYIGYGRYVLLEESWDRHRGAGKTSLPLFRALTHAGYFWSEVWGQMFPPRQSILHCRSAAPRVSA